MHTLDLHGAFSIDVSADDPRIRISMFFSNVSITHLTKNAVQGIIRPSLAILNVALSIWTPKELHMPKDCTNMVISWFNSMGWHNSNLACRSTDDVANETICVVPTTTGFALHNL